MKKDQLFIINSLFLIVLFLSMTAFPVVGSKIKERTGHDFDEPFFAIDLDLNRDADVIGDLADEITLIKDYTLPSNPLIDPSDIHYPDIDRQFFLSYVNTSGIETAFLALEKVEQDVTIEVPSLGIERTLVHINGTTPFQSLVQHYKTYDYDVFVTNFFNAFIAYETDSTDPWIDQNDQMYLGYTLIEQHLLDAISDTIVDQQWDPIGKYNWNAFFKEPDTNSKAEWGIEYTNMMVFWQDVAADFPVPTGFPSSVAAIEGIDGVVTGGDLVAATVFDSMNFTYELTSTSELTTDDTGDTWQILTTRVQTKYNLGAVSLLITRDDAAKLEELQTYVDGIDEDNSFNIPEQTFELGNITFGGSTYIFEQTVPSLTFYRDLAARQRISAAAMEGYATGMGISVASTTNMFSVGYPLSFGLPTGEEQIYPIVVNDDADVFTIDFTNKNLYTLDRTLDGGLGETWPIKVETVTPGHVYVKDIFTDYFQYEAQMMSSFLVYMARMTSPMINAIGYLDDLGDIDMTVDSAGYMMFVEMPKWSGYPIEQDPSYTAYSAVRTAEGTETHTDTESSLPPDLSNGIPGFELLTVVTATSMIVFALKRRK